MLVIEALIGFFRVIDLLIVAVVTAVMTHSLVSDRYKKSLQVADLELLANKISTIRELAVAYWSHEKSDQDVQLKSASITGHIHGCLILIQKMDFLKREKNKIRKNFSKFRYICQEGEFRKINQKIDYEAIREIESRGQILYADIMSRRRAYAMGSFFRLFHRSP